MEMPKFCDRICPSFKAKRPKILILEGLNYLARRQNFFIRLAEKFCQELQHWRML